MSLDLDTNLNLKQKEAVESIDGPMLILAGAGAGKTRVLTYKIAHMIKNGVDPYSIIALTFTNKAAKEMKVRVNKFLSYNHNIWISTFHSSCARILRENISHLGYNENFTIYDEIDSRTLIKQVIKKLNISDKIIKPQTAQSLIDEAKNNNIKPNDFKTNDYSPVRERALRIYTSYQKELKKNNAVDFGDLLMLVLELFNIPEILEKYQRKFKYVLVDEYQDTNKVQYLFLKKLAGENENISVVGDEDQSIYRWRGADINNILDFSKHYKNVKVIKLEENYRSTKTILSAANEVVKNNQDRIGKTIWTSNAEGEAISLFEAESDRDEAKFVAQKAINLNVERNIPFSKMGIFYRTNAQSRVLEETLRRNNISYRIFGGLKFYERAEIKDIVSYLKIIVNPSDDIALKRILKITPGIGKTTVDKIFDEAGTLNLSVFNMLNSENFFPVLKPAAHKNIKKFNLLINNLISLSEKITVSDLYDEIIKSTSYLKNLEDQKTVEALSRIENLNEFKSSLKEFEATSSNPTLLNYLEEVSLLASSDIESGQKGKPNSEHQDSIVLMTLHMAKGLEFNTVFVVGLEEKLLPHSRSDFDPIDLEEERRLFYVGMTRAEKLLFISNARMRNVFGRTTYSIPSRFLDELPRDLIKSTKLEENHSGFSRRNVLLNDQFKVSKTNETTIVYESPGNHYKSGMRVNHKFFGSGKILRVEGKGENSNITILFSTGMKKIRASNTSLEVIQ